MPSPNVCCNPLYLEKHNCVYKGLKKVTKEWSSIYLNLVGKYVCNTCRIKIKKKNVAVPLQRPKEKSNSILECGSDEEIFSTSESDESHFAGKIDLILCLFSYMRSWNLKSLISEEFLLNKSKAITTQKSIPLDLETDLATAEKIKIALSKETDTKKTVIINHRANLLECSKNLKNVGCHTLHG